MKIRHKAKGWEANASRYNVSSTGEIIVIFPEGDMDSMSIRDFEIFLEQKQTWEDMVKAYVDHDLISDNYNTFFLEPPDANSRVRGYK